jgi:hypothetical protein
MLAWNLTEANLAKISVNPAPYLFAKAQALLEKNCQSHLTVERYLLSISVPELFFETKPQDCAWSK